MMQASKLHLPAYTQGKSLLKPLEVEDTQSNAHVRIHVESVIGVVCRKSIVYYKELFQSKFF